MTPNRIFLVLFLCVTAVLINSCQPEDDEMDPPAMNEPQKEGPVSEQSSPTTEPDTPSEQSSPTTEPDTTSEQSSPTTQPETKSSEAVLIQLELESQNKIYTTQINQTTITVVDGFPYGTTQMKIHAFEISENAQIDIAVGDVFQLDQGSISINIQAENGDTQTYSLQINIRNINILIIDRDTHAIKVADVIQNKLVPAYLTTYDLEHKAETLFDLDEDIEYHVTNSYDDFNPELIRADIVNRSFSVFDIQSSKETIEQFLDPNKFPEFPLVINSAGNGANTCSQFAYDFALEQGGISWLQNIAPHYGCDPNGNGDDCDPVAVTLYKACDLGVAYILQEHPQYAQNFIIVGDIYGRGQKPGPILKDRWISTYYKFTYNDGSNFIDGTSYSTPYVAKIAAEIKRRAPHYSNEEIAQLIFSTAHEAGEEGVDEVYGHGILNPKGIFDELTRRGY